MERVFMSISGMAFWKSKRRTVSGFEASGFSRNAYVEMAIAGPI
jgi:hypothetical protein